MIDFIGLAWPYLLFVILSAYLLGSVNFAIIVTKFFTKTDIRDYGSGNAGATNVLRSQGKLPALLTIAGDLAKSAGACLLGWWLMNLAAAGRPEVQSLLNADEREIIGKYLAGLVCIIGHLYPIFFGFRGGKGVATTLGMSLILDWRAALVCLAIFTAVLLIWRMVSLGSIIAGLSLVVMTWLFRAFIDDQDRGIWLFSTIMAAGIIGLIIVKHIPNIKRIVKGTESKF